MDLIQRIESCYSRKENHKRLVLILLKRMDMSITESNIKEYGHFDDSKNSVE